jgi:hypothetical protein
MCSTSEPSIKVFILAYCLSRRVSIIQQKRTFELINTDIVVLFDGVSIPKLPDDLDFDRASLDLLGNVAKTEGVNRKDRKFLWFVGEAVLGDEFFGVRVQLVLFDFFLSQPAPKTNVDHRVPVYEVHLF